jgi:hypothetical protein
MANKPYCLVSGVFFLLVALAHLLRAVFGIPVLVDDYVVPMSFSWVGFIVPGALAMWAFRSARLPRDTLR